LVVATALHAILAISPACSADEPGERVEDLPAGSAVPCLGGHAEACLDPSATEALLASSRHVRKEYRLELDGAQWLPTLLALDSPFYVREQRLTCALRFGDGIDQCNYLMEMVLSQDGGAQRRVSFAKATPLEGAESEACIAYADCTARIRIGSHVPVPRSVTTPDFAILLVMQANSPTLTPEFESKTPQLEGLRVDFLRGLLGDFEKAAVALRREGDMGDRELVYSLESLEQFDIEYLRLRIAELERGD